MAKIWRTLTFGRFMHIFKSFPSTCWWPALMGWQFVWFDRYSRGSDVALYITESIGFKNLKHAVSCPYVEQLWVNVTINSVKFLLLLSIILLPPVFPYFTTLSRKHFLKCLLVWMTFIVLVMLILILPVIHQHLAITFPCLMVESCNWYKTILLLLPICLQ